MQERERHKHLIEKRQKSNEKTENIHQIKQNLLLINHISKSSDSKPKGKQLTTINMLDNLSQEEEKEEDHPKQKNKPNKFIK